MKLNQMTDAGFKEKPLEETIFQERREAIVEHEIEDITTQIASNMRANLDPEMANSSREAPLNESPLFWMYWGSILEMRSLLKSMWRVMPLEKDLTDSFLI